jgi:YVTN family beta-propeller protein
VAPPSVSRSLALSADGASLWVVNPESDSISQIDLASRSLKQEILLAAQPPSVDALTGRFDPAIRPRAIALVGTQSKAYVAGQAANRVFVVDTGTGALAGSIEVGAEPTAVVATSDGSTVYVVNHEAATVQKIDTATDTVTATVAVGEHPWGAALGAGETELYVTALLRNPGVTVIDTGSFSVAGFIPLADQPLNAAKNPHFPNGHPRAVYAVVPRPTDGELWVPHQLSSDTTPEPALTFDTAVFPTISRLSAGGFSLSGNGAVDDRLLYQPPLSLLAAAGSFTDSASGPRDVAFTPDGALALVAMAQSEDVMVFDANTGSELQLVQPIPSGLLEGIVVDSAGAHAYVHGRSTHNVTVLDLAEGGSGSAVTVAGDPIECLAADPMPAQLRRGLRLFTSSNSAQAPISEGSWLACSSCHVEGQTDAITWELSQGPRDTPSLAGGPINTGFLMRQALLNSVVEIDEFIRDVQGGSYDRTDPAQLPDLEALAAYVNFAIPFPQNPVAQATAGAPTAAQLRGQTLFSQHCASCHAGPYSTDSGSGDPSLGFAGPIVTHDVGSCVTSGAFPDQAALDAAGNLHPPCLFDTPTLRGIGATPPYLHDGSAATLQDAVVQQLNFLAQSSDPAAASLSATDQADLVAYLQTQ